ncbi:myelin-associated glycoprotein-like [Menidia menidia]
MFQLQFKMIVLLWASVFFSVGGSYVYSDASVRGKQYCSDGFCITLNEAEITAQAGLCVVIPCSFTTSYSFIPKHLVWYKCDHSKRRCRDSDIIFHSNNKKFQVEYEGRVSLLEPDVNQRNCSIVINDVRESDSGSYQLRVTGLLNGYTDAFTYTQRTTVSVKGLHQKPTVLIPPLTEGQPATLTCTAPGLCSGSKPQITWMWRGVEQDFDVTGNITTETKTLAAVTHTHSSSLTFNPSAEHHNTNITCKVNFVGGSRTEETVTLHVNYTRKPQISGSTTVQEGDVLNLTCSVDSFPPSKTRWVKFRNHNSTTYLQEEGGTISVFNVTAEDSGLYVCTAKHLNTTKTEEINVTVTYTRKPQISGSTTVQEGDVLNLTCSVDSFPPSKIRWVKFRNHNSTTYLQEEGGTISVFNVTAEDSGLYVCTAKHLNTTKTEEINVTVTYTRTPQISGSTTVQEGDVLNLTCSVDSFPPSKIRWAKFRNVNGDLSTDKHNSTTYLQGEGGTISVFNVTAEDSGLYVCTAEHLNTTKTEEINVTVTWFPKILKGSGCVLQAEILTCTCVSRGSILPIIRWPLLDFYTEYSLTTMVTAYRTVNSTLTLTAKKRDNITVECISSGEFGKIQESLAIQQGDKSRITHMTIRWLEIIIAFLSGVVLTAIICCLVVKCHRKNMKSHGKLKETLEMVTSQDDPLICNSQVVQDHHTDGIENGSVVAELNAGPKEVVYAHIDVSLLKSKKPREEREDTATEYAEVKTQSKEDVDDDGKNECERLEDKLEEAEETHYCVPKEEEAAEEPVYSTVMKLKDDV